MIGVADDGPTSTETPDLASQAPYARVCFSPKPPPGSAVALQLHTYLKLERYTR